MSDTDVGDLVIVQLYDPDTGTRAFRIDRADPIIAISQALLDELRTDAAEGVTLTDDFLQIEGTNRDVTYRLDRTIEIANCTYREAIRTDLR